MILVKMAKTVQVPRAGQVTDLTKLFLSLIEGFRYRYNVHEVFRDFTVLTAAEMHQLPYPARLCPKDEEFERVEAGYIAMAKKYQKDDFDRFSDMLCATRLALELGYLDFLGKCFLQLELNSEWSGQFFTPSHPPARWRKWRSLTQGPSSPRTDS